MSWIRSHWRITVLVIFVLSQIPFQFMVKHDEPTSLAAYETEQYQVAAKSCRDCHEEIVDEFQVAPHSHTLTSSENYQHWDRLLGNSFTDPATNFTYRFEQSESKYYMKCESTGQETEVDWIFGSGMHAQTPVSVSNEIGGEPTLLELAVSWYPESGLGATLGQSQRDAKRVHPLGAFHFGTTAEECFACHSTWLEFDDDRFVGKLQENVGCVRCHYDARNHANRQNAGLPNLLEDLSQIDAVELNRRCGVCHRSPDEMPSQDLRPDNKLLVRFAPVGISMSRCFTESEGLKCIMCHDPHRRDRREQHEYASVCWKCHDQTKPDHLLCKVAEVDSTDCLSCHMPQVEVQASLKFTDHWIRIIDTHNQSNANNQ